MDRISCSRIVVGRLISACCEQVVNEGADIGINRL